MLRGSGKKAILDYMLLISTNVVVSKCTVSYATL